MIEGLTAYEDFVIISLVQDSSAPQILLKRYRHLTQMKKELVIRLLMYADGNISSKMNIYILSPQSEINIDDLTVMIEFHQAKVLGKITVVAYYRCGQEVHVPPSKFSRNKKSFIQMYKISFPRIKN